MKKTDFILILDFGSQYTQLIARRIRELKVYCEIHPFFKDIDKLVKEKKDYCLKGVILSGGPSSVLDKDSPELSKENIKYIKDLKLPLLGICYGFHLIVSISGGKLHKSKFREYGHTAVFVKNNTGLFKGIKKSFTVWMSHGDSVDKLPRSFAITSTTKNNIIGSYENMKEKIYGLQFHPEVNHTEYGKKIIKNFVIDFCKIKNYFKPTSVIELKIKEIRRQVGNSYVICALSGGVDSAVAAMLLYRAIGKKLICIHVDNGLMRKNESKKIIEIFRKHFNIRLIFIDASNVFLRKLKNVIDPERKRKIIGKTFIEFFQKTALELESKLGKIEYLVQGTLYPDVIESVSFKGPSATIKSHHNVGGLPRKMKLKLIEPFRELFKDEVREIGKKLGLTENFIKRHPFPGPGLAIRIMSGITQEKLDLLKDVDDIFINELKKNRLYDKIWQAFSVLLPVQSVGVMGDERSYENVIALRAVTSSDGMTADFFQFEKDFLSTVSNKIINKVKGVNRIVYDISSKPPATIEWE